MTHNWHDMTALELGAAIAAKEISPVDLCDHFLQRIDAEDGAHLVYIRTMAERARAQAEAAMVRI